MPVPPYTEPNKGLQVPGHGADNDSWDTPVNFNWDSIDTAFGGTTSISVTGVGSGTYVLTLPQYLPPNIEFHGTASGALIYALPNGVGGSWSILNATTGGGTISFQINASTISLTQGARAIIMSNGTILDQAQSLGSPGNPTALVGLTALPGSAATYMRSDAAPAINQGIAPIWTGNHQFNGPVQLVGAAGLYGTMTVAAGALLDGHGGSVYVNTVATGNNSINAASTAFVQAQLAANGYASAASVTSQINTAVKAGQYNFGNLTGYDVMPSGRIEMWGNSGTSGGIASVNVLFSATGIPGGGFPTACDNVQITNASNTQELFYTTAAMSKTGFTANATNLGGGFFQWRATGH